MMFISVFIKSVIIISLFICLSKGSDELYWKANTKAYGDPCVHNDECVDFRMVCTDDRICECDQFHDWVEINSYISDCVLNIHRLRKFLSETEEKDPGYKEALSDEAHTKFRYIGLTGIISLALGVLLTIGCIMFVFC